MATRSVSVLANELICLRHHNAPEADRRNVPDDIISVSDGEVDQESSLGEESSCACDSSASEGKESSDSEPAMSEVSDQYSFFLLAGCNRSLGYRQSRLKRRKETEGPKHQSRSKSSALPLRPERLHSFCVKELGMKHKQQHKPKNTQQKPKTQTKQKHHNNHKREKSHP